MHHKQIEGFTHRFGAPENWDEAADGKCITMFVREELINGMRFFVSAWEPTPAELIRLQNGAPIKLFISARVHPVIAIEVGEMAEPHG